MKKTLIALTLAALPVASMAEVVLYGGIKGGVEVSKQKSVKGTETKIVDYGSRIGFKGKEQLNDSLKAIWQLEQRVNIGGSSTGFGTRDSFIGVESPAGTVKVGYMGTPLFKTDRLDQWEYSSDVAGLSQYTRGNEVSKRSLGVSYTTPDMAGFSASAYVSPSDNNRIGGTDDNPVANGKGGDQRRLDRALYGASANYQQPGGGFFADVAGGYKKNAPTNKDVKPNSNKLKHAYEALAQVGYENNGVFAGVGYRHSQNVDKDMARSQEVAASAAYTINNALTLKGSAAYGFNRKDINDDGKLVKLANGKDKYVQGVVGADYNLSKRTVVNSQVGYMQYGKDKATNKKMGVGTVGVGMSHKF